MSNPRKIEDLSQATSLQDDDLMFVSVLDGGTGYVSKKVTLKDIADYVRIGVDDIDPEPLRDDTDPEPIVVEDEPEQTDEPVSTTKASIAGAATCTANTSSTTYSTKTQQIIASSIGAARNQRNRLVAAHQEWVSPSDVYGSHNVWYFTYKVPNTTSTTTSTYGHSISEQLTLVS